MTKAELQRIFATLSRERTGNGWFLSDETSVYLRFSYRRFEEEMPKKIVKNCLDIASIESFRPGAGWQAIRHLHENNPMFYTYIENVLEPRLERCLERRGWLRIGTCPGAPSFYKRTNQ